MPPLPPVPHNTDFQEKGSQRISQPWLQWLEMLRQLIAEGGSLSHNDLTDVTPDQHHPQEHEHDGTDGSGTVSYNDLTDIGILDHDHDGDPTQQLVQVNTHNDADTDLSVISIHHTLGQGNNQAAAGNHDHGPPKGVLERASVLNETPQVNAIQRGWPDVGALVTEGVAGAVVTTATTLGGTTGIAQDRPDGLFAFFNTGATINSTAQALIGANAQPPIYPVRTPTFEMILRTGSAAITSMRAYFGWTMVGANFPYVFQSPASGPAQSRLFQCGFRYRSDHATLNTTWLFIYEIENTVGVATQVEVDTGIPIATESVYQGRIFFRRSAAGVYHFYWELRAFTVGAASPYSVTNHLTATGEQNDISLADFQTAQASSHIAGIGVQTLTGALRQVFFYHYYATLNYRGILLLPPPTNFP